MRKRSGSLLAKLRYLAKTGLILLSAISAAKAQFTQPHLIDVSVSGGQFSFAFHSEDRHQWFIQSKADLSAPQWTNLVTFTNTGTAMRFTDAIQTNSSRVYRGCEGQIYTVNAVGYVNRTFVAGTNLISNPLNQH